MSNKQEYIRVLNALKERSTNNRICDSRLYEATIDEAIKAISSKHDDSKYIEDLDDIRALIERFDAFTLMIRKANGETSMYNMPPEKVTDEIFYIYTILSLRDIGEMSKNFDSIEDPFKETIDIIKNVLQALCLKCNGKALCGFCCMKDGCGMFKVLNEN